MEMLNTVFIAEPYGSKVGVVSLIDDGKFDKYNFEEKKIPQLIEVFSGFDSLTKNDGRLLRKAINDMVGNYNVNGVCVDYPSGEILVVVKSPSVRTVWNVDETKTVQPSDELYRSIFIHELIHAMDVMFEHCGVKANDTELRAYTFGYMYMKCARLIKSSIKQFEAVNKQWKEK